MRRYEHGGDIYTEKGVTLDFSVSTNPLGMPQAVKTALVENIPAYECYPDPQYRTLRAAVAQRASLPDSMVLCGNGASELILAICAALRPKTALVTAPAFSEYERSVMLFGGDVCEHRLVEANGFDVTEHILARLSPDVDMLFLCTPNNPTGRLIPADLLAEIARACRENGTTLVLDECFIGFTRGESMLLHLSKFLNILLLGAFTKLYAMAGLRLGTLFCSDTQLLAEIARFCTTWGVSAPAQLAGLAALGAAGWAEQTRVLVETERAWLSAQLAGLGLTVYPSDANFLLLRSEAPVYELLRERGILIRSCANFSGLDERYARVGLKTRAENKALVHAVAEALHG